MTDVLPTVNSLHSRSQVAQRTSRPLEVHKRHVLQVAAEREAPAASAQPASAGAESACVSPRVLAALRARVRELRSAPPAARALALPASDTRAVRTQVRGGDIHTIDLPFETYGWRQGDYGHITM